MKQLSEKDQARLKGLEKKIQDLALQLGYLREKMLRTEQELMGELTALRSERKSMVNMLAREYIGPEDLHSWQFNADEMTFEHIGD